MNLANVLLAAFGLAVVDVPAEGRVVLFQFDALRVALLVFDGVVFVVAFRAFHRDVDATFAFFSHGGIIPFLGIRKPYPNATKRYVKPRKHPGEPRPTQLGQRNR